MQTTATLVTTFSGPVKPLEVKQVSAPIDLTRPLPTFTPAVENQYVKREARRLDPLGWMKED